MAKYDFDIGIIGGGAAGLTVASGSSQLGAKVLLIDKEQNLGGDCLHFGCVPSKTLIKTAKVYHLIKNSEKFGLPKVEFGEVDFKEIKKRIKNVIEHIQQHDSIDRFCSLGVHVEIGYPQFIDDHQVKINGKKYSAKKWVIATGSSPSAPPIKGLDQTTHLTNKEIFSLEKLPSSMVILGGGPIAIEMAQAFSRLGTKVFVIQRSAQILTKEDADVAGFIQKILESEGVEFYTNTKLIGVSEAADKKEVVFEHKNEVRKIVSETIFVAMGRRANLDGLGLENIDVEYTPKGLKLDNRLRTTQKHIYGAGDVTGTYQLTHAAGYEGAIVIANAIFHVPRKVHYANIPRVIYTDPEIAAIGLNEKEANKMGIRYSLWKEEFDSNDRAICEGESNGFIKMLVGYNGKPLGVQIVGLHAGEILSEWVAIFNGKVKLSTIASSVYPYPTLSEINKRVTGNLLSSKLFSEKVKKTLKFFFHFKGRACLGNFDK